jgi:voltage-gated potassium channel
MKKEKTLGIEISSKQNPDSLKNRLYEAMFETSTPPNKIFDTFLAIAIITSVLVVIFESVTSIKENYNTLLLGLEWFFVSIFTIEYIVRIFVVPNKKQYITSFFGIIDLIAILPSYAILVFGGSASLMVIRILRLLRMFRVLKLTQYIQEANFLIAAIKSSMPKILVFLLANITIVVIAGSAMYLVEGPTNGFNSILDGMYWGIATLTTTGYGDIVAHTPLGKFIASIVMLLAYAIIAVPTGILSAEIIQKTRADKQVYALCKCGKVIYDKDAEFCHICGRKVK